MKDLHTFVPFESNLKTTKSASAKHHPGSEAWREERKKVQRAPCAGCANETRTDSKEMEVCDTVHSAQCLRAWSAQIILHLLNRSEFKMFAQFRQKIACLPFRFQIFTDLWQFLPKFRHSIFDIRYSTFDIRHSTFDIRQSTFDIRHSTLSKFTNFDENFRNFSNS